MVVVQGSLGRACPLLERLTKAARVWLMFKNIYMASVLSIVLKSTELL